MLAARRHVGHGSHKFHSQPFWLQVRRQIGTAKMVVHESQRQSQFILRDQRRQHNIPISQHVPLHTPAPISDSVLHLFAFRHLLM